VAHALVKAREMKTGTILVNLSGRGDKDMDYVIEHWGIGDGE
jgi:tryptophan synthase beta chain